MSEREEKRGGSGCATAGIALILLPVLYVLGIGPAYLLAKNWPVVSDLVRTIYFPVNSVAPFREPLEWYIQLWTV